MINLFRHTSPRYACGAVDAVPTPCAPGTFATRGKTNCTVCPGGYYCPFTRAAVQVKCTNGTYVNINETHMMWCNMGS